MLLRRLKHQGSSIVISKSSPIDRNCKYFLDKTEIFLSEKWLKDPFGQKDIKKDNKEFTSTVL